MMNKDIFEIAATIILRLFDVVLICLIAYGVNKKDEPGDWKVWFLVITWFVATGILEKFL